MKYHKPVEIRRRLVGFIRGLFEYFVTGREMRRHRQAPDIISSVISIAVIGVKTACL